MSLMEFSTFLILLYLVLNWLVLTYTLHFEPVDMVRCAYMISNNKSKEGIEFQSESNFNKDSCINWLTTKRKIFEFFFSVPSE